MNKNTKTAIMFLIAIIILTITFGIFLSNYWIGLAIGIFLSISFFYDPKKLKNRNSKVESIENETDVNSK